ncbi:MAG: ATP-binding protein [Bdellovibrionota bacterium]
MNKIFASHSESATQAAFVQAESVQGGWETSKNTNINSKAYSEFPAHELPELFVQIPAPMAILVGREKVFRLANPPFVEMIGHDPVGHTIYEVFSDKEGCFNLSMLDASYATGTPYRVQECPIPRPMEGKTIYVNVSFHPFKDGPRDEMGTFVFCQDVTEQVEARQAIRESENYFRSLAETLPQIIWTAKPSGEINYTNSQWTDFSASPDSNWVNQVHPEDRRRTREAWMHSVHSGEPLEIDVRFRSRTGVYRWFLLRAVSSKDALGRIVNWYGSATDIEERKLQAKELSEAKSEAERANATKSAFLANMSHEIRTPLGAILGFTDLLRDPGISAEEKMGYLDIISRNGKSLTRVIDDILDLSKVEAGHLEIEKTPFCMPDVLSEIVSLFSETVKAKDLYLTLTIDSNVPGTVLSDPARLRQILINIIGNAVKFTSVGGIKVKVESSPIGDRTAKIIISVSDTGPGLMRSQQKKLFQPFTQADNTTTRKFGGTGLGLALSRRLAQAMGGNIGISACKIRRGCTFQISIEVGLPEGLAVAMSLSTPTIAASLQPKVLSHARVLLVEDAVDNQVLIKRILTKNGAEVDLASNGLEGMQKALDGKGKYTIVLMDIQMPIMDGYEAIRKLRASGYRGPVFALTAHAMAEERKKTQAAGYDGHLTKPLDTDVLIQTVRKFS